MPSSPAPDPADAGRHSGIAIGRAFALLRCFTPEKPLLSSSELVRLSGLPRSTVSRIACTLEELGYLYRLSPMGKYRLGWGVVALGYPLLTSMPLRQVARPEMHALSAQFQVNVNMGTLHRTSAVYVESTRFDETSVTRPDIGILRKLLTSAIGRALLWSLDDYRRKALLNRVSVESPELFAQMQGPLVDARKMLLARGFCISMGETSAGLNAVAVPMRVVAHEEPIAFNGVVAASRFDRLRLETALGPALVSMVARLESRMGV
jgi:DNA-binding IclR family transcriptional regulator